MRPGEDPVDHIEWRAADELRTNDWNPNIVHAPELRLLETSILENGWVQPVLVNATGLLIDGFHRVMLAMKSKPIRERYAGEVPCAVLDLDDIQAKGSHVAIRLSALVKSVIDDGGLSVEEVARQIGATSAEVELLHQDDVFKARDIAHWPYSKAWVPEEVPSATD